jgi:hypothetical protein
MVYYNQFADESISEEERRRRKEEEADAAELAEYEKQQAPISTDEMLRIQSAGDRYDAAKQDG